MTACHFLAKNDAIAPRKNVSGKTINITFTFLFIPINQQKFKKIVRVDPKL